MILVTGATGVVGRPLVHHLVRRGAAVRALTRSTVADLPGEVVTGDPSRPETVVHALRGVTALFLNPRTVGDHAPALLALAREHGVRRVVALTAANVDEPLEHQPSRSNGDRNKEAEDAAVASGLEWASLRAGSFAVNTLRAWGAQIRSGEVVRGPYADFPETPVHEDDLAEVAAHALLTDDVLGRKPVLTGPEILTHAEMAAVIGEAIGRPLRFEELPPETVREGMVAHGHAPGFVDALMARYARDIDHPIPVSREVEKILGRPARTFAEWAADHAEDFTA
jgi:uncharacterized protein YbjT (DUF2867 family)